MTTEQTLDRGAVSLLIDRDSPEATQMQEMTLASAGLRERDHLPRWVTEHPELIGPGLLLITTEFGRWEVRDHKVADRLDALFLDATGAPVVVEFKRDRATDTVELLVAGGFGPAVTSVVLWLREYGVDIGCVEVSAQPERGPMKVV